MSIKAAANLKTNYVKTADAIQKRMKHFGSLQEAASFGSNIGR
jgi:hypothetical protein